jgi:hypothetical protein
MLKLGEKIISDIYLGDKKIAKVFLGDKLVYQANKPIFLDYVESTGEQYINTDYIMTSDVQEVECEFQYTDSTGTQQMFGLNVPSKDAGIFPSTSGGNIYFRGGSMSYGVSFAIDYTKKHTLYAKAELGQPFIATFDGKTNQSANPIDVINTTHPWYLFGLNNGKNANAVYCYKGKIYLFKMYDNGVLVRDLRPCLDPKGIVCMYDMVTKKYFYNQGTGTLTAGNKIKFVDYIETDGNSYINTGIIGKSGLRVVYDVYISNASDNSVRHITGSRQSSGETRFYLPAIRNGCWDVAICSDDTTGLAVESDKIYHIDIDTSITPTTLTIDGVLASRNRNTITTTYPMYLFAVNNYGTATMRNNAGMRIYDYKCYEGETLLIHFKPCVVAGEAGFYDMVTGNIFTNAGTGTLKASGRFVESIVFDGASYIDTGIIPVFGDKVEIYSSLEQVNSGYYSLFSSGVGTYQFVFLAGFYTQDLTTFYKYFETGGAREFHPILNNMTFVECFADGSVSMDGQQVLAPNKGLTAQTVDTTMFIGARATKTQYWLGKIGTAKLIASDGTVRFDLRPYVDENGTACFKDIVTGKLFYNQGTGKLEYTE